MYRTSTVLPDFQDARGQANFGSPPASQVVAANPDRVFLHFQNSNSGTIIMDIIPGILSLGGLFIIPGGGTLDLWWERHGMLVTYQWFATVSAGAGTVWWYELSYRPTLQHVTEG